MNGTIYTLHAAISRSQNTVATYVYMPIVFNLHRWQVMERCWLEDHRHAETKVQYTVATYVYMPIEFNLHRWQVMERCWLEDHRHAETKVQ